MTRLGDLPHHFIFECRNLRLVAAGMMVMPAKRKDPLLLRNAVWSPNPRYALTSLIREAKSPKLLKKL
jgi:hypothetical protein